MNSGSLYCSGRISWKSQDPPGGPRATQVCHPQEPQRGGRGVPGRVSSPLFFCWLNLVCWLGVAIVVNLATGFLETRFDRDSCYLGLLLSSPHLISLLGLCLPASLSPPNSSPSSSGRSQSESTSELSGHVSTSGSDVASDTPGDRRPDGPYALADDQAERALSVRKSQTDR